MRRLAFVSFGLLFLTAGASALSAWANPALPMPETIRLAAGLHSYRAAGDFRQGTRVVDAPLEQVAGAALDIMKYHVTGADYAACVADAACAAAGSAGQGSFAQTNINHGDATAYAAWFSDQTDARWRLPTDAEWLRAAGDRGVDDAFAPDANGADPSRRWIASYRREVASRGAGDLTPHPLGHFGLNDLGVADIAGNVWEWTDSCLQNGTLTADGKSIATRSDYCGVRAVQGKHRAFVIDFIRDARSGGCAAGVPPDYLGFRLVREVTQ